MEPELQSKIEETVLQILKSSNVDETTEYKIRQAASEQLGVDLSPPARKLFVRTVVESYLSQQKPEPDANEGRNDAVEGEEEGEDDDDDEGQGKGKRKRGDGAKEYDDNGDLIVCKLSAKRRVTLQNFRGKTLVSIREYYSKDGKDLPSSKGISLTTEQWSIFKENVPAIEKAIRKMESRFN